MCGITGFINITNRSFQEQKNIGERMAACLQHRGPDSNGIWIDEQYGVVLAHARLAILDLSPAGHQPMQSFSGRYVLIFNGEIYNHLELRTELEKHNQIPERGWRGYSDTETLLAYIEFRGIEKTLQAAVGMFAIALWDTCEKSLTLARDRMGEKPLYYGWQNGCFLFASELKALRCHPSFIGKTNRTAVNLFLHLGYVPAPHSIYEGVFKLRPGTCLKLNNVDFSLGQLSSPVPYWSLVDSALTGAEKPFSGDFNEAKSELERLLLQAVQQQSIADVPVGAFLSGGIDSSMTVALMQAATSSEVTTFSIGMPDARMDESGFARKVAEHLGTNHVEHIIQPGEALEIIPELPRIWDEPFADSSQIPTHMVCRFAKQQVSVALSGDGGDELFCGYNQYFLFEKIWKLRVLRMLPWKVILRMLSPFLVTDQGRTYLRRAKAIIDAWNQPNAQALNIYWMDKFRQVPFPFNDAIKAPQNQEVPVFPDVATTASLWDAAYYLPDDILVKVDRAAMAVSLETRAPFLDHRVVEFAHSLPPEFKTQGDIGKRVLREVLYKYVPKPLVERPKMGFSIPLSSWLKKELRPWAEELLNDTAAMAELGLDVGGIQKIWREHVGGYRDHTDRLWGILNILSYGKYNK